MSRQRQGKYAATGHEHVLEVMNTHEHIVA